MKIVTKEEFFDWIKKQPNERKFNYSEYHKNEGCGCPMAQYGIEHNFDFDDVAYKSWMKNYSRPSARLTDLNFSTFYKEGINTYGELKKHLKLK